jgi:hypothetical protein
MSHWRALRVAACAASLCAAIVAGPVTGAQASDASIKAAIKKAAPQILISEGHVVSAIGQYKLDRNSAPVQSALQKAIAVLRTLRSKIAAQPAVNPQVKLGKAKLEKGLHSVIVAYESLKSAFGLKLASPEAAKAEATKALETIKKGGKQLAEGVKLLRK